MVAVWYMSQRGHFRRVRDGGMRVNIIEIV
jgi:hypothetical protein